VFQRDAATGALTFVEQKRNGVGGVAGLHGAAAVAVSPDGYSIYATGSTSDAVADFEVRRCGDGVLDPDEQCDDGNREDGDCCSSSCQLEPATTVCRPAAGSCDAAETCDGASDGCPQDRSAPDGTPCDDGNACTQNETCQQGGCVGGDQVGCNDGDACTVDTCDPLLGCVNQHLEGP